MKNQQNISQLKQFKISSLLITKINGGDKKATAKLDTDLE